MKYFNVAAVLALASFQKFAFAADHLGPAGPGGLVGPAGPGPMGPGGVGPAGPGPMGPYDGETVRTEYGAPVRTPGPSGVDAGRKGKPSTHARVNYRTDVGRRNNRMAAVVVNPDGDHVENVKERRGDIYDYRH